MSFEKLHAQVDPDPLVELKRRQQMWASAPPSRDTDLHACIVPDVTVAAAIYEIERLRAVVEGAAIHDASAVARGAINWKR